MGGSSKSVQSDPHSPSLVRLFDFQGGFAGFPSWPLVLHLARTEDTLTSNKSLEETRQRIDA